MVLKKATLFFFFISIMVMVGHAMVPHDHNQPNNDIFIKHEHHTLYEKLKEIFSVDIGIDHLNEFNQTDILIVKPGATDVCILLTVFAPEFPVQQEEPFIHRPYHPPFPSSLPAVNAKGLRAPPFMN